MSKSLWKLTGIAIRDTPQEVTISDSEIIIRSENNYSYACHSRFRYRISITTSLVYDVDPPQKCSDFWYIPVFMTTVLWTKNSKSGTTYASWRMNGDIEELYTLCHSTCKLGDLVVYADDFLIELDDLYNRAGIKSKDENNLTYRILNGQESRIINKIPAPCEETQSDVTSFTYQCINCNTTRNYFYFLSGSQSFSCPPGTYEYNGLCLPNGSTTPRTYPTNCTGPYFYRTDQVTNGSFRQGNYVSIRDFNSITTRSATSYADTRDNFYGTGGVTSIVGTSYIIDGFSRNNYTRVDYTAWIDTSAGVPGVFKSRYDIIQLRTNLYRLCGDEYVPLTNNTFVPPPVIPPKGQNAPPPTQPKLCTLLSVEIVLNLFSNPSLPFKFESRSTLRMSACLDINVGIDVYFENILNLSPGVEYGGAVVLLSDACTTC